MADFQILERRAVKDGLLQESTRVLITEGAIHSGKAGEVEAERREIDLL